MKSASTRWLAACLLAAGVARGQALLTTAGDGDRAVFCPTPGDALPNAATSLVTGFPVGSVPHGATPLGFDRMAVADGGNARIHIVRSATAGVEKTISTGTPPGGTVPLFGGSGSIAASPAGDVILAADFVVVSPSSGGTLTVGTVAAVRSPLSATPSVVALPVPGLVPQYQTQAIAFDSKGRGFIYSTAGISIVDAPYDKISFTIPVANAGGGALAVTPDGQKLLATTLSPTRGEVFVFSAPFSQSSTPVTVNVPGGLGLDGVAVTPDGATALVVSRLQTRVVAIAAPFVPGVAVEDLPIPNALAQSQTGFEDVDVSPNGQLAIATGGSSAQGLPALFIRAPFTRAGATSFAVPIPGGRGAGAGRFFACQTPAAPATATIEPSGNPGGPVTATDFLRLSWTAPASGIPPNRYEYRVGGRAYSSVAGTSVDGVPPVGSTTPVQLFVRAYACNPSLGPGPETSSAVYALAPPSARFLASATTVPAGREVTFTDTSSPQATAWLWFFGNTGFSSAQNPRFTFTAPGVYAVVLVAINGSGTSVSAPQLVTVTPAAARGARANAREDAHEPLAFSGSEWEVPGLLAGRGSRGGRPTLTLAAAEETVAYVVLSPARGGAVERRLVLAAGETVRVDLAAYLPPDAREARFDLRLVANRSVTAALDEAPRGE